MRLVVLLRATTTTIALSTAKKTIAFRERLYEKPCCCSFKLFFFFREMILEKGPSLTSQKSGYGQSHERGGFCLPPPFSSRSSLLLLLLLLFSLSLVVLSVCRMVKLYLVSVRVRRVPSIIGSDFRFGM